MDRYEWKKNAAIVDRMYYSERCLTSTTLAAAFWLTLNGSMIKSNYLANAARARIAPTLKWYLITNVAVISILQWPLTAEER